MQQIRLRLTIARVGGWVAVGMAFASAISPIGGAQVPIAREPSAQISQAPAQKWRLMKEHEQATAWDYILNSPLGIAALNQLAIEGFISRACTKTFYINDEFGGFQTLLRVKCPDERGISTAVGYDEMRVIFNRFEDNIENFEVERVSSERPSKITIPE